MVARVVPETLGRFTFTALVPGISGFGFRGFQGPVLGLSLIRIIVEWVHAWACLFLETATTVPRPK